MTYSSLTKDYPRYPSVFECSLTEEEKNKLMVGMIDIAIMLC